MRSSVIVSARRPSEIGNRRSEIGDRRGASSSPSNFETSILGEANQKIDDVIVRDANETISGLGAVATAAVLGHVGSMETGLQKGERLANRLLNFSADVLDVVATSNLAGKMVARQLVRCGPAAGAHYEEARGAESRADFVHKLGVALKELRETVHWLKLIDRARLIPHRDLKPLIREGGELVAILTAAARTARSRTAEVRGPSQTA